MDVCSGPLIWYDVPGEWGDVNARRLAECKQCGDIVVIAGELDPRHREALVIEGHPPVAH